MSSCSSAQAPVDTVVAIDSLRNQLVEIRVRLANFEGNGSQIGNSAVSPRAEEESSCIFDQLVQEPPRVSAFDAVVEQHLAPFTNAAVSFGDGAQEFVVLAEKSFTAQRAYLLMTSASQKPVKISITYIKVLRHIVCELHDYCTELFNHQRVVSEGMEAFGWICVESTPKPVIEQTGIKEVRC